MGYRVDICEGEPLWHPNQSGYEKTLNSSQSLLEKQFEVEIQQITDAINRIISRVFRDKKVAKPFLCALPAKKEIDELSRAECRAKRASYLLRYSEADPNLKRRFESTFLRIDVDIIKELNQSTIKVCLSGLVRDVYCLNLVIEASSVGELLENQETIIEQLLNEWQQKTLKARPHLDLTRNTEPIGPGQTYR